MKYWPIHRFTDWHIAIVTDWNIAIMTDWHINWLTESNYVSIYWLSYIMNYTDRESTQRLCTCFAAHCQNSLLSFQNASIKFLRKTNFLLFKNKYLAAICGRKYKKMSAWKKIMFQNDWSSSERPNWTILTKLKPLCIGGGLRAQPK